MLGPAATPEGEAAPCQQDQLHEATRATARAITPRDYPPSVLLKKYSNKYSTRAGLPSDR